MATEFTLAFAGFSAKTNRGQSISISGLARISETGRDYDKSLEAWVVLSVTENDEPKVQEWLRIHPVYADEIASRLRDMVVSHE